MAGTSFCEVLADFGWEKKSWKDALAVEEKKSMH